MSDALLDSRSQVMSDIFVLGYVLTVKENPNSVLCGPSVLFSC